MNIILPMLCSVSLAAGSGTFAGNRYLDPAVPVEERIDDLMARMTVPEKIAQMDLWRLKVAHKAVVREEIEKYGLGGFLGAITTEKYNELQRLAEKQRLKIPLLIQVDACHGHGLQKGATVFPTNISMAGTFNKELAYKVARSAGKEVRGWGQHAVYTPTLDVVIDPRFGRSGETFGECPYVSSVMADIFVRGLQGDLSKEGGGVAACPKHYVGGGASIGGCNHASTEISERTLRTVFLPPFKAAVDAGALMIMGGHNDINGIPAHASKWLLIDVLKNEWGFTGFVVSDMGDVRNLRTALHNVAHDHDEALVMGMGNGVDMYMDSRKSEDFFIPMQRLVAEGRIPMERIDDAVRRILRVKFMLGLFENRYLDEAETSQAFGSEDVLDTALQAARECVALVKNNDKLLPIDTTKYKKIFVTGPNADHQALLGDWASPREETITVIEGLRGEVNEGVEIDFFDCGYMRGKPFKISKEMADTADPSILEQQMKEAKAEISDWSIAEAVKRAQQSDLIVAAVGGNALRAEWGIKTYGESCDLPSIGLYGRQLELIQALYATGKPVVVVVISGKVVSEPWINKNIDALLYAWEPGQFGGQALAEILFGEVNPSGKLPFTLPRSIGHIPQYYYQRQSRFWTGHGSGGNSPAFPFGHGLSYTTFEYSSLSVPAEVAMGADVHISVTVKNTGERAGKEAVLLFLRDKIATIAPFVKMLKGFEKVELQPGESRTVEFTLAPDALALWNREMKHVAEPGAFNIMISDQRASFLLKE